MKKKKKVLIIIAVLTIIIFVFLALIYKNVFAGNDKTRNGDISKYKITNNEKNDIKDKINELEEVESIDIHTNNNSRIIKIIVKLKNDVDFEKMKELANSSLSNFNKKNLSYYDIEFYIDTVNEESEVYPKIGYKFKSNSEFSW